MDAAAPAPPPAASRDDGSIVLGWLTRIALTLTILGITVFEVLSIVVANVSMQDYGQLAGQAAITSYASTKSVDQAYEAAVAVADEHNATIPRDSFQMMPDGGVTFDINATATTLLLYRLDQTASLAKVHATIHETPFEESGQQP